MHSLTRSLGVLGLLAIGAGCHRAYMAGYSYYPQPATVEVLRRDGDQRSPLIVLASVLGVHNSDEKNQIPYSVIVRMRFENVARSKVSFDPGSLDLVTGTLRGFAKPIVRPPQSFTLEPGERREITVYFPFTNGTSASQMNMRNLRLRWEVKIDSTVVVQTAVFERIEQEYDADYDVGY